MREADAGAVSGRGQRSIVEVVIDELRAAILDGSLAPGEPVSISRLSARLDVSHIPVREALRRLESEGLVELRRGRSAVVAPLSIDDLQSAFHLRALIESDAMARAVRSYTESDVDRIEKAFRALSVRPDDEVLSVSRRHLEFHRLLVGPAASDWDARLLDMLWKAGERYIFLILIEMMARPANLLQDEHQGLLKAARARSAREARVAVTQHLQRGIELIAPKLEPSG